MNTAQYDFYLKVAHSLSGCQMVEQGLKLYITEAYQLASKCIAGRMTFKLSGKLFEEASLERLIEGFKLLTDDANLVTQLRAFKDERNFLSHRAIANCTYPDGELSDLEMSALSGRIDAIKVEADRLATAVHEEANKFRAHLYFDDLSGTK